MGRIILDYPGSPDQSDDSLKVGEDANEARMMNTFQHSGAEAMSQNGETSLVPYIRPRRWPAKEKKIEAV